MPEDSEVRSSMPKSKLNAGLFELMRLHEIWMRCHQYKRAGNLAKWNDELDCAWTELDSDLDIKKHKQYFDIFDKLMADTIKFSKNRIILNQILMKKQIFLKRVQNVQGKGTAYIDETEDDFE